MNLQPQHQQQVAMQKQVVQNANQYSFHAS
jgi:hypothetical protein